MELKTILAQAPKEIQNNLLAQTYKKGSHILFAGEGNDYLYFLIAGLAEVYTLTHEGVMISLNTYTATSFFGEYEVFNPKMTTHSVIAKTDCEIIQIHKNDLYQWMQKDFRLTLHILEHFATDVMISHQTNTHLAYLTIKERVLTSMYSHYIIGDLEALTKNILVQEVFAPLRSVNRAIAEIINDGTINYQKKRFMVSNEEQLIQQINIIAKQ